MKKTSLYLAVLTATLAIASCSEPDNLPQNSKELNSGLDPAAEQIIADFEFKQLPSWLVKRDINVSVVSDKGVTNGDQALKLNFDSSFEYNYFSK